MNVSPTKHQARAVLTIALAALLLSGTVLAAPDQPLAAIDQSVEEPLRAAQDAFRAVAAKLSASMVRIETVGGSQPRGVIPTGDGQTPDDEPDAPPRNDFNETTGSSFTIADGPTTGVVYSADGYIISSSFNFVREPLLITATLPDGRRVAADLIARDQVRKIALLKVDANDLVVPQWADESGVRVGAWAIALGLGFGGDSPSVTVGIVSALDRMQGHAMQTDAKLSPANYGGPVCDIHGRILGIAVPMAQRPGELAGIEMYDCGVGFAIPRRRVDEIVADLKTGRSFYRGWLGVQLGSFAGDGLEIKRIAEPSPMHDAGVMPGDVLVQAEGRDIRHMRHVMQALYLIPAGELVHLRIMRDGAAIDLNVRLARNIDLGPLPDPEDQQPDPFLPEPDPPDDE